MWVEAEEGVREDVGVVESVGYRIFSRQEAELSRISHVLSAEPAAHFFTCDQILLTMISVQCYLFNSLTNF